MHNIHSSFDIAIVGAGIAGVTAANTLQKLGLSTLLIEQHTQPGGRATSLMVEQKQFGKAVFDFGAQYFTVRSPRMRNYFEELYKNNVVSEWSDSFPIENIGMHQDKETKYKATKSFSDLVNHLISGSEIVTGEKVESLFYSNKLWHITTQTGERQFLAKGVILTPPIPHTLSILDNSKITMPLEIRTELDKITYDPCIVMMLVLENESPIPEPGAFFLTDDIISWISDNKKKGVSPEANALTVFATDEFSTEHFYVEKEHIAQQMLEPIQKRIGNSILWYDIHKWKHSQPISFIPEPCTCLEAEGPLVLAGDAFVAPNMEGAIVSGLMAAERISQMVG